MSRGLVAVDFETKAIGLRPENYPPKPVGVAIYGDGQPKRYLAWGHPSGNNSSLGEARRVLKHLWQGHELIFHNSAFDCEVACKYLELPLTPEVYHDTLFLAFLIDPRSEELSLKPLAERFLNMKPSEQLRLKRWILENLKQATEKDWGAYIADAPVELVAPYAIGDVVRTYKLFKVLSKKLSLLDKQNPPGEGQQTLWQAYEREIKLMPVLVKMEARGITLNISKLKREVPIWTATHKELTRFIITRLGGQRKVSKFGRDGEPFNISSSLQLANALEAAGKIEQWVRTAKGNRSTSKKALDIMVTDKKLLDAIKKRSIYDTYLDTYGKKWININVNGKVFPRINQVRNRESREERLAGTRTGRLSYGDSWQAIPSPDRRAFTDLPNLRNYVVPSGENRLIAKRDYTQQEYRILAHYEAGKLLDRYREDPFIDMHNEAREMILALTGVDHRRRIIKDVGFGQIYGLGVPALAEKLGLDLVETKNLRSAYLAAIPGLPALMRSIKQRCQEDLPIRTWGGRLYWVEPPAFSKKFNKVMTFDYKMINILIQGSAADCTKEAMIRADATLPAETLLLLQMHDELLIDVAKGRLDRDMKTLRETMESIEFDVLMLSDGATSSRSWGQTKAYKDKR